VAEPKIWVTSDWHFNHDREFIWKPRGFESIQDMNIALVERHNTLVSPDDEVYVLGDLMLGGAESMRSGLEWIRQMHGHLHIVLGNHDTEKRIQAYLNLDNVEDVSNVDTLKYKKHHFYMSHYPTLTGNLEKESLKQMTLNLFGHTHQKTNFYMDMPYMYHVGVDSHDCKPVLLDDIIEEMYAKVKECKDFLDIEEESAAVTKVKEERRLVEANWDLYYYKSSNCDKCVWQGNSCSGPVISDKIKCPNGIEYKRDPPDGGYYG